MRRAALILLLGGLALSWGFGALMVRPSAIAVAPAAAPAVDVPLRSEDGLAIAGTYRPGRAANAPAVLLLHGNNASRAAVDGNAAWLAAQGYATLAIDFRGHGESAPAPRSFGYHESRDAAAALRWLKTRQQGAPVAAIGISLGGAALLLAARRGAGPDAMILQAVYPDIRHAIRNRIATFTGSLPAVLLEPLLSYQARLRYGVWPAELAPIARVRGYRGPLLVIGGGEDGSTPPQETRALYAAAPGRKALWIAPGLDHAQVSDIATPEYRVRIRAFLRATIGPA